MDRVDVHVVAGVAAVDDIDGDFVVALSMVITSLLSLMWLWLLLLIL